MLLLLWLPVLQGVPRHLPYLLLQVGHERESVCYIEVFPWDVLNDVVIAIQTEAKLEYAHREGVKLF